MHALLHEPPLCDTLESIRHMFTLLEIPCDLFRHRFGLRIIFNAVAKHPSPPFLCFRLL
jgi:hypothetical protein